jgi:hypothetical protein
MELDVITITRKDYDELMECKKFANNTVSHVYLKNVKMDTEVIVVSNDMAIIKLSRTMNEITDENNKLKEDIAKLRESKHIIYDTKKKRWFYRWFGEPTISLNPFENVHPR